MLATVGQATSRWTRGTGRRLSPASPATLLGHGRVHRLPRAGQRQVRREARLGPPYLLSSAGYGSELPGGEIWRSRGPQRPGQLLLGSKRPAGVQREGSAQTDRQGRHEGSPWRVRANPPTCQSPSYKGRSGGRGAARLERRSPTDGQPVTSPHGAPVRLEVSECGALLPPGEPTAQAPPLSCGKKLLEDPGRSLGGQPWDHPVHGPLQTQRDLTGKENDAHKERQEDDEASVAPKSHGTPAA